MAEIPNSKKKALLDAELFKKDPLWFRGAVAYRLLRIMTPKPLTRRLPTILRRPLLLPGFTFPPDWFEGDILPPGIILPPGVFFPPGWEPGDPLPDGTIIDTDLLFPDTWLPGDPAPDFVVIPPSAYFPPGWTPSDPLPDGLTIDTGIVFPVVWMLGDPLPPSVIDTLNIPWPSLWKPGDPLPGGVTIDPETLFPVDWMLGDPIPPSIIVDPDASMPPIWPTVDPIPDGVPIVPGIVIPVVWMLGDPLPVDTIIDTSKLFPPGWLPSDPWPDGYLDPPDSFSDYPDIDSPVPPGYIAPSEPAGPVKPSSSSPPLGEWIQQLDDASWDDSDGIWNESEQRWAPDNDYITLQTYAPWVSDFWPTKFRVTFTGPNPSRLILGAITNVLGYIYDSVTYTSGLEAPCTFRGDAPKNEIFSFLIMDLDGYITNVEFFVP